jgi:hypothetical protein
MYNSQTKQDLFVHKLLKYTGGYFVDIGAGTGGLRGYPEGFYSNSYFFEKFLRYEGIAIDFDEEWIKEVESYRTCQLVCEDLMEVNINDVLNRQGCPLEIDYLSIDVDDAQLKVFTEFDWNKYRFKVLTLEHNLFQALPGCTQNHSEDHKRKILSEHKLYRDTLRGHNYHLLWGDVILDGYGPVEDWWVSEDLYEKYKSYERHSVNCNEVVNALFR